MYVKSSKAVMEIRSSKEMISLMKELTEVMRGGRSCRCVHLEVVGILVSIVSSTGTTCNTQRSRGTPQRGGRDPQGGGH